MGNPYPDSGGVAMGYDPNAPGGNSMPSGPFTFPDLVQDPGGTASNTTDPNDVVPPGGPYDLNTNPEDYRPPVLPDPYYDASRSGGPAPGVYDDPILANAYSNSSAAGGNQLNMQTAMSHPSYSQAYVDYLRSQGINA
jgi:hypothetical protein